MSCQTIFEIPFFQANITSKTKPKKPSKESS